MYSRILVPLDGSEAANRGLMEAIALGKSEGAMLRLVHVVNDSMFGTRYAPTMYYDELVESMRAIGKEILGKAKLVAHEHAVKSETVLLEAIDGRAADFIVAQAQQWPADVIVMGTHGRRGLQRLVMGSDAEMVLRLSPVPVLMVRAGPQTP